MADPTDWERLFEQDRVPPPPPAADPIVVGRPGPSDHGGLPPGDTSPTPPPGWRHYPVLTAIVVVTLAAYVAQLVFGPSYADHLDAYGPVIRSGQWWRLLTVVLVHVSWVHVGSNMAALAIWGRDTERRFGGWGLLGLYVATAVASSALAMAVHPDADAVGASGAVFGVMGALIAALWRRRHQPGIRTQLQTVAGFALISLVLAATIARTDNAAHAAGLVTGALFGGLLDLALHRDDGRSPSGPAAGPSSAPRGKPV